MRWSQGKWPTGLWAKIEASQQFCGRFAAMSCNGNCNNNNNNNNNYSCNNNNCKVGKNKMHNFSSLLAWETVFFGQTWTLLMRRICQISSALLIYAADDDDDLPNDDPHHHHYDLAANGAWVAKNEKKEIKSESVKIENWENFATTSFCLANKVNGCARAAREVQCTPSMLQQIK